MEDENTEVLFESWCLHYQGSEKETFRLRSPWRKRYLVISQDDSGALIHLYDRKPKHLNSASPKGGISLQSRYKIEKLFTYKGQKFACRVSTTNRKCLVAFHDEKLFHLFAFFVQTQTKLREELEGECFIVRPDNSDCQQKIGARGNMCLLHISQYGVILALQLSKCILAWWPLKSIKCYESLSRQQFGLEAGRRAPMGEGVYMFNTRAEQDNHIYDRLDNFVMEAAGLRQIIFTGAQSLNSSLNSSQMEIEGELDSLQALATVEPDQRFTSQLQRISRNIYDQLGSQHFGSTRKASTARNSAESTVSDPGDTSFVRSVSQKTLEKVDVNSNAPLEMTSHTATPTPCKDGGLPTNHMYENSQIEKVSMTSRKIKQQNVVSSYLKMGSPKSLAAQESVTSLKPTNNNSPQFMDLHSPGEFSSLQHPAARGSTPEQFHSLQRMPNGQTKAIPVVNYKGKRSSNESAPSVSFSISTTGSSVGNGAVGTSPKSGQEARPGSFPRGERAVSNQYMDHYDTPGDGSGPRVMRQSHVSSGSDPSTPYEHMSSLDHFVYAAESVDGDSAYPVPYIQGKSPTSPGTYSYANPREVRLKANGNDGAHHYEYARSGQTRDLKPARDQISRDASPPMMKPRPAPRPTDLYAMPKLKAGRRSLSNPDLIEGQMAEMRGLKNKTNSREFEDIDTVKEGVYESPVQTSPSDGLAFANNMFKDEFQAANKTGPESEEKPAVRPKPALVLSLFNKNAAMPRQDSSQSGRSLSVSPISPHTTSPRGISFTPNSKSFKRSQPVEHSSPMSPHDKTPPGPSLNTSASSQSTQASQNSNTPLLRNKGPVKATSMEGRRLPSLPADAHIGVVDGVTGVPGASGQLSPDEQYEKVGVATFC